MSARESLHQRLLVTLLLLLFFGQVLSAATQTSLTSDEGPQLTSGYAYLVTGDPRLITFDGSAAARSAPVESAGGPG